MEEINVSAAVAHNEINIVYVIPHNKVKMIILSCLTAVDIVFYFKKLHVLKFFFLFRSYKL